MWRAVLVCDKDRVVAGKVWKLTAKEVVIECPHKLDRGTAGELVIEFPSKLAGGAPAYLRAQCKVAAAVFYHDGFKLELHIAKLLDAQSTRLMDAHCAATRA